MRAQVADRAASWLPPTASVPGSLSNSKPAGVGVSATMGGPHSSPVYSNPGHPASTSPANAVGSSPALPDWGIDASPPQRSVSKMVALGVVFCLTCTAGALLWRNYSPLLMSEKQSDELVQTEEGETEDEVDTTGATDVAAIDDHSSSSSDDDAGPGPIPDDADADTADVDDSPRRFSEFEPRGRGRSTSVASNDRNSSNPATIATRSPARSRSGGVVHAAATETAGSRGALHRTSGTMDDRESSKESSDSELDALLNDNTLDAQNEPSSDDEVEEGDSSPPKLNIPGRNRGNLMAARRGSDNNSETDENEVQELPDPPARNQIKGRTKLEIPDSDLVEVDPSESRNGLNASSRRSAQTRPVLSTDGDEAPVELASSGSLESEGLIVEEGDDGVPEGFVEVDPNENRALAQTRVLRPSDNDTQIADADTGDDSEESDLTNGTSGSGRIGTGIVRRRDSDRQPIEPRGRSINGTDVARQSTKMPRAAHFASEESTESAPSTMYQVEPNDTYWSISKKVYGTPRYFQALAEHNRERVAEPEQLRPGVKLATPSEELLNAQYAKFIPGGGKKSSRVGDEFEGESKVAAENSSTSPGRKTSGRAIRNDDRQPETRAATGTGFFVSRDGIPLYRVSDGDTLSSIAQHHLGKSSRSYELYQLNQDRLANPDRLQVGSVLRLPSDASRVGVVSKAERIR